MNKEKQTKALERKIKTAQTSLLKSNKIDKQKNKPKVKNKSKITK